MFVVDVKCPQATWQTVPNSWADSAKASVSKVVVRTWYRAHVIRGRPKGSSVAFGDEMDVMFGRQTFGRQGRVVLATKVIATSGQLQSLGRSCHH